MSSRVRDSLERRNCDTNRLDLPVSPLIESSSQSNRARCSSSSTRSALQSTASMEPTSGESSGVVAYQTNSGRYDSLARSSRSPTPAASRYQFVRIRNLQPSAPIKKLRYACSSRAPRRKGSALVFLLNVIKTFAFYGAIDNALRIVFVNWRKRV